MIRFLFAFKQNFFISIAFCRSIMIVEEQKLTTLQCSNQAELGKALFISAKHNFRNSTFMGKISKKSKGILDHRKLLRNCGFLQERSMVIEMKSVRIVQWLASDDAR